MFKFVSQIKKHILTSLEQNTYKVINLETKKLLYYPPFLIVESLKKERLK